MGPQSKAAVPLELGGLVTVSPGSSLLQLPGSLLLTQQTSSWQTQEPCQTAANGTLSLLPPLAKKKKRKLHLPVARQSDRSCMCGCVLMYRKNKLGENAWKC